MPEYTFLNLCKGKKQEHSKVKEIKQYQKKWLQHVQREDGHK